QPRVRPDRVGESGGVQRPLRVRPQALDTAASEHGSGAGREHGQRCPYGIEALRGTGAPLRLKVTSQTRWSPLRRASRVSRTTAPTIRPSMTRVRMGQMRM